MSKRGAGRPPLRTIMSPVVTLAMKQVGQVVRELHMSRNRNSKEAGLNLFRLEELEKRMCATPKYLVNYDKVIYLMRSCVWSYDCDQSLDP